MAAMVELTEDSVFEATVAGLLQELVAAYQAEYRAKAEGQIALSQINVPQAQAYSTGAGTVVAVIDTGIYLNHWFLADAIAPGGIDLVGGDLVPNDEGDGIDNNGNGLVDEGVGHGTFIAGLILLVAPDAKLLPIRAQDSDGGGWSFIVAEAIYRAVDAGADVINLSLSIPKKSMVLGDAIEYAASAGVVVVAAVGNDAQKLRLYPAALKGVIGVAAVDSDNHSRDIKTSRFHSDRFLKRLILWLTYRELP